MAWLQFGSVFPLSVSFPFSSSISSPFIAAICPTFSVYPLSLLFRVVAAPHGALTVTLWVNLGSCVSFNSYVCILTGGRFFQLCMYYGRGVDLRSPPWLKWSIYTSWGAVRWRQAGTISCRASWRGNQSPASPPRAKTGRTSSSLLGEVGVQQLVRWVVIFTFQHILSPQVVHFAYVLNQIATYWVL